MSPHRRLISVFLGCHLVALAVSAVPSPAAVSTDARVPGAPPSALSTRVTPLLDKAAAAAPSVLRRLAAVTSPVSRLTAPYLQRLGLYQTWRMFTSPPRYDSYVLMRYFVASSAGGSSALPAFAVTELIYPSHPEDEIKGIHEYRDSYRNKAVSNAMERFHVQYSAALKARDVASADPGRHLAPVARYYARRFAGSGLGDGERLVRAELWHGVAANAVVAGAADVEQRRARARVLQALRDGPVRESTLERPVRPLMFEERSADISWALDHVEQW